MTATIYPDPAIVEAIGKIERFILQTTGEAPTTEELSSALTRYFVMKEITDFVKMSRAGEGDT